MEKKIILISQNPEDLEFIEAIAATSKIPFVKWDTAKEASQHHQVCCDCILFVDISTDELIADFVAEFGGKIGDRPEQIHPRSVHLIGPEDLDKVGALSQHDNFGHFIARKYGSPREAGQYYGNIIEKVCINEDFELRSLIGDHGKVTVLKIGHSTEKSAILEKTKKFLLQDAGIAERIANFIVTAVDEILMNAIYDAPTDDNGNQILSATPRNTPIVLTEKSSVELHLGFDGQHAAFKVVDRFGSLNKSRLVKHLFATHHSKEYQSDSKVANAGIGLATTFRTGGSLLFVSEPNVRTEVTTFFKASENYKAFRNQFKFISIHIRS
jgi:hypothetical protein